MFTVKLYRDGRARIDQAEFVTVVDESAWLKGITLHRASPGIDEVYYVGTISECTSYADRDRLYTRAIVENAAGKTTEIIHPLPPMDQLKAAFAA